MHSQIVMHSVEDN